jgi:lipopolysaccharide transport system ATP-binding protein
LLIVDEALAVGDEPFQRKCFARIERLREQGVTVLFVSHDMRPIITLCDRACCCTRAS